MKKIYKIFLALGLSCTLFLATEQEEARATGWPTIDVSNLLQNILGYIQDATDDGLFDNISDIGIKLKMWDERIEAFKNLATTINAISRGARYATQIIDLMQRAAVRTQRMAETVQWLNSRGATAGVTLAAINCVNDFESLIKWFVEDQKTKSDFMNAIKEGTALDILQAADAMMKDFERNYFTMESHFENKMRSYYFRQRRIEIAIQNGAAFRNSVVF